VALAAEYAAMFEQLAATPGPAITEMSPAEGREMYRLMRPLNPDISVGGIEDRTITGPGGDIALRVYTPEGEGPFGIYINFHGGGWVIGDLDTADASCRDLCNQANCIVVSVDYRLAPEHAYPAAVEDSYAATSWVSENTSSLGGNGKLAVGGESAGGNLAAVVALKARDEGGPAIDFQLLAYPVVDADLTRQSYIDNGEDYLLTTQSMRWFWDYYCPDAANRTQPEVSPIHAASHAGLPPALIVTAEFDPLRDEGEAYAQMLSQAGVEARSIRFDGLVHDFFATAQLFEASGQAFTQVAEILRDVLAK
jgi:acetyl esterase